MSALEHSQLQVGFPFSASEIRVRRPLQADGVNAPFIAEASGQSADLPPISPVRESSMPAALRPGLPEGRPIGRQNGMRVLPLGAFVWGSRASPPQPRTRPDHVLIWVTKGQLALDFPRDRVALQAGDLRFIPAGTAFAAAPGIGTQGHVALISTRLALQANPPLPDRVLAAHVGSHAAQLEATLREIAIETPGSRPGHAVLPGEPAVAAPAPACPGPRPRRARWRPARPSANRPLPGPCPPATWPSPFGSGTCRRAGQHHAAAGSGLFGGPRQARGGTDPRSSAGMRGANAARNHAALAAHRGGTGLFQPCAFHPRLCLGDRTHARGVSRSVLLIGLRLPAAEAGSDHEFLR